MKINKKLSTAIVLSLMMGVYGNASAEEQVYLTGIDSSTPGTVQIKDCLGDTIDIVTTAGSVTKYVEGDSTTAHSFTVSAGKWTDVKGSEVNKWDPDTKISSGNSVTIAGTASVNDVCGGYMYKAGVTVEKNTVTIKDSATVYQMFGSKGSVVGGFSLGAYPNSTDAPSVVKDNVVNIEGVKLDANVKGASIGAGSGTFKGNVTGNTVTIKKVGEKSASLTGYAMGGSTRTGNAEDNIVKITGSTVEGSVAGGNVNDEGNANSNKVTIDDGIIGGYVQGGATEKGNAISNTVSITNGTIGANNSVTGFVYGGHVDNDGNAQLNKVNIAGNSVIYNSVYGGFNGSDDSNNNWKTDNNEVNITGNSRVQGNVYGGYALNGNVGGYDEENEKSLGNTVSINGAGSGATERVQITRNVYGGKSETGTVNNNKVGVVDSTGALVGAATNFTAQVVYGGYGKTGATGNKVWLGAGAIASGVYGGDVDFSKGKGNANNNEVKITNGASVTLGVTGGNATKGEATENTVVIDSSTVGSYVIGGMSDRYDATGNIVTINNSELGYQVYGGLATGNNANAKGNTVTISGDSTRINSIIYGGQSDRGIAGGSEAGEGNTVTVSGGQFRRAIFGGASAYSDAINNTVNFEKGTIKGDIYGGSGSDIDDNGGTKWIGSGNAIGNKVKITGGKIDLEGSAGGNVYGGYTLQGTVSENTVTIDGGEIAKDVYGAKTENGDATNNKVGTATNAATNFSADYVYGGKGKTGAAGNEVYLGDGVKVNNYVYGGRADSGDASGNSVSLKGTGANGPRIEYEVYGGYSINGAANSNKVGTESNVATNFTSQNVYGGKGKTGATGNEVWLGAGVGTGSAYGGYVNDNGSAASNKVNINGSEIGSAFGAHNANGDVTSNEVKIAQATIYENVFGGESKTGNATSNKVTITNSIVGAFGTNLFGYVYGGYVNDNGNAASNEVTISGDSKITNTIYGGYVGNYDNIGGNATSNSVTISGGEIVNSSKFVYGGYAVNGNATSNTVTIEGGTISSVVIGGHDDGVADSEKVTDGNKVTITGGTINNAVYGGSSKNNNALNNSVEINGSAAKITGNVYGGSSWGYNGIAKGNKVDVKNGTLNKDVIGGFSGEYNVEENVVSISGGTISGNVYGGDTVKGNASKNTVEISGGTVRDIVYGGKTEKGTANNNKVGTADNVAANFTSGSIYGGRATTGAKGNEVHIGEGADVKYSLYGGYSDEGLVDSNLVSINGSSDKKVKVDSFVYGGDTVYGASKGNKVGSEDNVATNFTADYVYGGRGETGAEGNEVYLGEGVVVSKEVYGGRAGSGAAKDNKVYITDDANVTNADVYGGKSVSSSATSTGNTLNIDTWTGSKTMKSISDFQAINIKDTKEIKVGNVDGLTNKGVGLLNIQYANLDTELAGLKVGDEIVFIETGSGDALDTKISAAKLNTLNAGDGVWLSNKTGFGVDASKAEFQINATKAFVGLNKNLLTGNLVDEGVAEDLVLDTTAGTYADIYGAYSEKGTATAAIVNMDVKGADLSSSTIHGSNVAGAETTLNVKANGAKVGGIADFANMNFYIPKDAAAGDTLLSVNSDVDLSNVKVAAGFHNDTALGYGDKVILINAGTNEVSGLDGVSEVKVDDTDFTEYDVMVYQGDASMNQVESGTATTLVAEMANMELKENSKILAETIVAGATVVNDGSDMLAGAGFDSAVSAIAADLETGAPSGSMSIFGAISSNKSKVHTGSHIDVKGWNMNLGLAKELKNKDGKMIIGPVVEYGRGDYDSYLDNGYHGEGNSHYVGGGVMAKQINDNGNYFEGSLRSGKLTNEFKSTGGSYDHDVTYLAGHIGLGHVQKMNEKNSMDYYAKYFHTHVDGDDIKVIAKGKDLDMTAESMTSARLRVGTRLNHKMSAKSSYYIGFAWQREFSGTAEASLAGKEIASPSMKGNSGFMELGVKLFDSSRYDLDLGGFGSVGKKEGAGFNFNFNWKF